MSTLSLRLPESLHKRLNELAKREGISVDQLAATALGEKIAALLSQDYLEQRAQRASRTKFDNALAKIRDVEPEQHDRL